MKIRFDGKIVVIIGGSTGIGQATVRAFAASGGTVIFTGIEPESEIDLNNYGENVDRLEYCRLDNTDEAAVKAFAEHVDKKYGGVDILHNNAGILIAHVLHECSTEEWKRTMDINVTGMYFSSKYFLPQMMRKGGGAVVNTASMSGLVADSTYCAYNTSKGAVANLTRNMALDYAPYHIRVNAVAPGSIMTQMCEKIADKVGGMEILKLGEADVYPIGRNGYPEEVANCVLFLASEQASFVTGHNLVVDGGITVNSGAQRHWDRIREEYERTHQG